MPSSLWTSLMQVSKDFSDFSDWPSCLERLLQNLKMDVYGIEGVTQFIATPAAKSIMLVMRSLSI